MEEDKSVMEEEKKANCECKWSVENWDEERSVGNILVHSVDEPKEVGHKLVVEHTMKSVVDWDTEWEQLEED